MNDSIKRDFSGLRFGRLLVVSFSHKDTRRKSYWNVVCDCGNVKVVAGYNLGTKINSCGCLQRESRLTHSTTHGMRNTRAYAVWNSMRQRCNNKNSMFFSYYGARGIYVCERWIDSFENFIEDMGFPPDGMSIDRIDNSGPYCKENCRWSSSKSQARNRRSSRIIAYNGTSKTLSEWAECIGIGTGTLHTRLNRLGWTVEKALTTPIRTK